MTPTPAARAFAAEVSLSFDRMTAAAEACVRPSARHLLRVSAPTTFALRWLIPRLERFHAGAPDVEVTVTTTTTLHEELRGGFDVAIRRGSTERDAWPQHRSTAFLPETDTLIISPALFDRTPLRHPTDIANHVLLASETRPGDWADWLARATLQHRAEQRRRVFDHFFATLQAVIDGLGLGIGPLPVLQTDVCGGADFDPVSGDPGSENRRCRPRPLRCQQNVGADEFHRLAGRGTGGASGFTACRSFVAQERELRNGGPLRADPATQDPNAPDCREPYFAWKKERPPHC